MKLISCHIENFGKLHDFSIDFKDGANIICKENGWGKSTFAAFVRAMFYGLEGERKRSIKENEFTRYTPWQGGMFGGSLTFEIGDKQYIVTRTFGKTNEFELRDAKTNLVSTDYSNKLGEEIFQVNRESFMRTVFIGQADCETSSTDAINAKIGALTDNSDDLINFESANKKLTDILNSLNPKRVTGSISKRQNEITELERKVKAGNGISSAIDVTRARIEEKSKEYRKLKTEVDELRKEQEHMAKLQLALGKKDQWEFLKRVRTDRKEELLSVQKTFGREVPEEKTVLDMLQSAQKLGDLRKTMLIEELTKKETKKIPTKSIIGVVLLVVGVILAIVDAVLLGIFVATVGVALGVLDTFTRKNRSAQREKCEEEIEAERLREAVSHFLLKFEYSSDEERFVSDLHDLYNNTLRYAEAKRLYQEAETQLETFEKQVDIELLSVSIPKDKVQSLTELAQKLSDLSDARENCYRALEKYQDDLDSLQRQYDEWEENRCLLQATRTIQEEEQQKYEYVAKAQRYLSEAKESLTAKYTVPVFDSFKEYYETITESTGEQVRIDANTNVTVVEQGKQRETTTLSSGYRDLIGICLRLALVDAMYQEERPVLIMDDPFSNLDDKKMKSAKELLRHVAEKYQVIYFTCSDTRR